MTPAELVRMKAYVALALGRPELVDWRWIEAPKDWAAIVVVPEGRPHDPRKAYRIEFDRTAQFGDGQSAEVVFRVGLDEDLEVVVWRRGEAFDRLPAYLRDMLLPSGLLRTASTRG